MEVATAVDAVCSSAAMLGLSTSPGTFTGTCGFIHGNTCSYGSPVRRYLVLKTPTDPGVEGESAQVTCGTRALQACKNTYDFYRPLRHPSHRMLPTFNGLVNPRQ